MLKENKYDNIHKKVIEYETIKHVDKKTSPVRNKNRQFERKSSTHCPTDHYQETRKSISTIYCHHYYFVIKGKTK